MEYKIQPHEFVATARLFERLEVSKSNEINVLSHRVADVDATIAALKEIGWTLKLHGETKD